MASWDDGYVTDIVYTLMAPLIWIRGRMSKEALASSFGLTKSIKANGLAHEG
jgi:hypothetical protein